MSMIDDLRARISPEVKENEPLSNRTTFKIGGPAEFFLAAKTVDDAVRAARAARELGLPIFVFGGGSNILVSDEGVKGLVVKMANQEIAVDGVKAVVGAGAPTGLVAMRAAEAGLSGFEWAAGIPGTIGGAIRGNAGCYGGEMKDIVESVRVLDLSPEASAKCDGGVERTLTNAECGFAYRDSAFKRAPGRVIVAATLALAKAEGAEASKARLRRIILDRKEKQPVEYPTAGCMFMNWRPASEEDLESLRRAFDLDKDEQVPRTAQASVPAGWIIDRAQLKGMKVGHVQVSEKHGNFFLNDGKASASDVVALTAAVKTRIRNMTNGIVQLREEVEYVGF